MKQGVRSDLTDEIVRNEWWEGLPAREAAARHDVAECTIHAARKRLGLPGVTTLRAWAMRCEAARKEAP